MDLARGRCVWMGARPPCCRRLPQGAREKLHRRNARNNSDSTNEPRTFETAWSTICQAALQREQAITLSGSPIGEYQHTTALCGGGLWGRSMNTRSISPEHRVRYPSH
eukprot:3793370-Prymnesium_polylepis.1